MSTRMSKQWKPESGDHWWTITSGMSGHFAVHLWMNPEMGGFVAPWATGFGRYYTAEAAYAEAKFMAKAEYMMYIAHPELESK